MGLKFLMLLKVLRLGSCKAFSLLNLGPPKCLRKASIYKSLEVGEQHVTESDWFTYVIAYTCWAACVIAYMCKAACVIAHTYADV